MSERRDKPKRIQLDGREYVILSGREYERLAGLARVAEMPPLPEPEEDGTYDAVAFTRASIARDLVRERALLGLSQTELAERAGVRVETLCRVERGRHTASTATLTKLERALNRAKSARRPKSAGSKGKRRRRDAS